MNHFERNSRDFRKIDRPTQAIPKSLCCQDTILSMPASLQIFRNQTLYNCLHYAKSYPSQGIYRSFYINESLRIMCPEEVSRILKLYMFFIIGPAKGLKLADMVKRNTIMCLQSGSMSQTDDKCHPKFFRLRYLGSKSIIII